MKRKWIFLVGVALSLGALATVAAAESESEENTQEYSRLEQLDLTDAQKEQLQALREQHREVLRVLREQHREAQNATPRRVPRSRAEHFDRRGSRPS